MLLKQHLRTGTFLLGVAFFVLTTVPAQAQTEVEFIKTYLKKAVNQPVGKDSEAKINGLSQTDINEMKASSAYRSPSTGWFHAYFNQTYKGVKARLLNCCGVSN